MTKTNLETNSGVRPAQLTQRVNGPRGSVAYCNLCDWSSAIICGVNDDGWERASTYLAEHRKSADHRAALAGTD